jgi:hypothetical protein
MVAVTDMPSKSPSAVPVIEIVTGKAALPELVDGSRPTVSTTPKSGAPSAVSSST